MGDVAGDGADGYYRRYTYDQLLTMVLADSVDDAEANRVQWRRLGQLLSDAATAADKIAKQIPDHYRSQHGAPALLELLNETNKTAYGMGQIAYDNGTAWLGVKQSLQDAQADVMKWAPFAQGGMDEHARNSAADRLQKLTSEYINHANELLPPDVASGDINPGDKDPFAGGSPTNGDAGGAPVNRPGNSSMNQGPRGGEANGPGGVGMVPVAASRDPGRNLGGSPTAPPGTGVKGPETGRRDAAGHGASSRMPGLIGSPGASRGGAGGSFGPVGRTLGGTTPSAPNAPGGGPSHVDAEPRTPGSGAAMEPPEKPGTPGVPGSGGPGGPSTMTPHEGGGRGRRQTRRRGGLKGDPNDFRYQADVVAPPEIWPDEERQITNVGKTIGGKQVTEEPQWYAPEPVQRRSESKPSSSPLPEGEVRIDGHNVSFKMRRSGSA